MKLRRKGIENIKEITINENNTYTISTARIFDEVAIGPKHVVGFDKQRHEFVVYDQNMLQIEKLYYPYEITVKKYECPKMNFWVVSKSEIMYFLEEEIVWLQIPSGTPELNFYKIREIEQIFPVNKKSYIIKCEYYYQIDIYNWSSKNVVYVLDIEKKQIHKILETKNDELNSFFRTKAYYKPGERFMIRYRDEYSIIVDFYTKRSYEMDDPGIKETSQLEVKYSSKEIIILLNKNNRKCYLYMNEYLLYKYEEEKHDRILQQLKKINKEGKFTTLIIENQLFIWQKGEEPKTIQLNT